MIASIMIMLTNRLVLPDLSSPYILKASEHRNIGAQASPGLEGKGFVPAVPGHSANFRGLDLGPTNMSSRGTVPGRFNCLPLVFDACGRLDTPNDQSAAIAAR